MPTKKWTKDKEAELLALKEKGISDSDIVKYFKREFTAAAITDKYIRLMDAKTYIRNGQDWTQGEVNDLLANMRNTEFCSKWQRGRRETNQKRFDLLNPKGKEYGAVPVDLKKDTQNVFIAVHNDTGQNDIVTLTKLVERYNRELFDIDNSTPSAVSSYQKTLIMVALCKSTNINNLQPYYQSFEAEKAVFEIALGHYNFLKNHKK